MLLIVLVCSLSLAVMGQRVSSQAELESCSRLATEVVDLQRKIEDQQKNITKLSQQPSCNPVFRRFLSRLLHEIQRVGVPSDSSDVIYDAKVKLSRQSMAEIQTLLEGEDSWRTGALDNAISQILVGLRPHDHKAWRWRFEDTFGVELDTLLKIGLCILVFVAIICTQLWSTVSWFTQFGRLFAVSFLISIFWNWFYLYKVASAERQKNIVKMEDFDEKCTGVTKMDWVDNFSEWFRITWTLQDDPCKEYFKIIMVDTLLELSPIKVIVYTIATIITEPLKPFGQGISEFLRTLLKDLPVTLQIPVVLIVVPFIMVSIVILIYLSMQAAIQHFFTIPQHRRDPPAPGLEQLQAQIQRLEEHYLSGGNTQAPLHQDYGCRLHGNQVYQRRHNRSTNVDNIGNANLAYNHDETYAERREAEPTGSAESDSEKTLEGPGKPKGSRVATQAETKPTDSKFSSVRDRTFESE